MTTRSLAYLASCALGLAVLAPLALGLWGRSDDPCGVDRIQMTATGPFDLVSESALPATLIAQMVPTLVYFGFTSCPDICPVDLSRNMGAVELLDRQINLAFVTTDPHRDTPDAIARYTDLFHPDLQGYTGTPDQIQAVADAFGAYYSKPSGHGDFHLVDHSGLTYFWTQGREKVEIFRNDLSSSRLADQMTCLMDA